MTLRNQSLRKGKQRSSLADKVSNNHAWSLAVWKSLRKMMAMQTILCGAPILSKKVRSSASLSRATHSFQTSMRWEIKCARAAGKMTLPLPSMHHVTKNKVSAIRLKSKICKQENWVYNFSLYVLWSGGWNFPPLSEFRPLMLCFLIVFFKGVCTIQSSYYLLNISLSDNYSQLKLHWSIFND